jgi:hypothetical protein
MFIVGEVFMCDGGRSESGVFFPPKISEMCLGRWWRMCISVNPRKCTYAFFDEKSSFLHTRLHTY